MLKLYNTKCGVKMGKICKKHMLRGEARLLEEEYVHDGIRHIDVHNMQDNNVVYSHAINENAFPSNVDFKIYIQCYDNFFILTEAYNVLENSMEVQRYTTRVFEYNGKEACKPMENETEWQTI